MARNGQSRFINLDLNMARSSRYWLDPSGTFPCSNVPTQFISMDGLASIWDDVQFSAHGEFVKEGLKIIAEDFENLAFVNNDPERLGGVRRPQYSSQRIAKVKLQGISKPISLNSMGDGMLRVLQLLLKIYPARKGFLLIDEFENGLHYSVQEKNLEAFIRFG